MGKGKRRRKKVGTLEVLAEDGLQSLEKIRSFLITAEGITASLHSLMGSYQAMQADGSLHRILSVVNDRGKHVEASDN